MKRHSKREVSPIGCAAVAIVWGVLLIGPGRSVSRADDGGLGTFMSGLWTLPGGTTALNNLWNASDSRMIPLPDMSACDACDFTDIPIYGERRTPYLGGRIRSWWRDQIRAHRKDCYYGHQQLHRRFLNPVIQPSCPPYGFHTATWTPFQECYYPPPPMPYNALY